MHRYWYRHWSWWAAFTPILWIWFFFFLLACESHQAATSQSSTYTLENTNPGTNWGAFIKQMKLCDLNMGRWRVNASTVIPHVDPKIFLRTKRRTKYFPLPGIMWGNVNSSFCRTAKRCSCLLNILRHNIKYWNNWDIARSNVSFIFVSFSPYSFVMSYLSV